MFKKWLTITLYIVLANSAVKLANNNSNFVLRKSSYILKKLKKKTQ